MLDNFTFIYNRKLLNSIRNRLFRIYVLLLEIKLFIQYKTTEMFDVVNLETSSNCNRQCKYCPNSKYQRSDDKLSLEIIVKIMNELRSITYHGSVVLTGYNEPLLDDRIENIIKIIRSILPDNNLIIYTNGDYLTKKILNIFTKYNVSIYVSLHDDLHKQSLSKLLKKVSYKARKKVYFRTNIENSILSTRGGLVKIKRKQKLISCVFNCYQLTIDYKGQVVLCPDDYFSKFVYGNIKNEKLVSIWNSKKYTSNRKDLKKGIPVEKICQYCF